MAKRITDVPNPPTVSAAEQAARTAVAAFAQAESAADHALLKIAAAVRDAGGRAAIASALRDLGYDPADLLTAYNALASFATTVGATAPALPADRQDLPEDVTP